MSSCSFEVLQDANLWSSRSIWSCEKPHYQARGIWPMSEANQQCGERHHQDSRGGGSAGGCHFEMGRGREESLLGEYCTSSGLHEEHSPGCSDSRGVWIWFRKVVPTKTTSCIVCHLNDSFATHVPYIYTIISGAQDTALLIYLFCTHLLHKTRLYLGRKF